MRVVVVVVIVVVVFLPNSQVGPPKPSAQLHLNGSYGSSPFGVHVPSFAHGLGSHMLPRGVPRKKSLNLRNYDYLILNGHSIQRQNSWA